MREQPHIEILGGVDQAVDRTARKPDAPLLSGVAQEELRDALFAREIENALHEIGRPLQAVHFGPQFAGQGQVRLQLLTSPAGAARAAPRRRP